MAFELMWSQKCLMVSSKFNKLDFKTTVCRFSCGTLKPTGFLYTHSHPWTFCLFCFHTEWLLWIQSIFIYGTTRISFQRSSKKFELVSICFLILTCKSLGLSVRTVINSRLTYVSKLAFENNIKLQYLWVHTLYNVPFLIRLIFGWFTVSFYVIIVRAIWLKCIKYGCVAVNNYLIFDFTSRNLKDNNLSTLSWRIFHHLNISYLWVQYQYITSTRMFTPPVTHTV